MKYIFIILLLLFTHTAQAREGRFLYEGDGKLTIVSSHTGKTVTGLYRKADGQYDQNFIKQADAMFGMPVAQMGENISLRLISMLDYVQDHFAPKRTVTLISGYRSPAHNANLRKKGRLAAKTSYHMEGMAADFSLPHVNPQEIWEYVRHLEYGGIGFYGSGTLHMDSGKPRFWTAATALPKENEDPQNRNIFLSPDMDFYKSGETMRLFFSGISNYPFGIKMPLAVMNGSKKITTITPKLKSSGALKGDCLILTGRSDVRFLTWVVSDDLPHNEKLSVKVEFCEAPYEKMPKEIQSRVFEIL